VCSIVFNSILSKFSSRFVNLEWVIYVIAMKKTFNKIKNYFMKKISLFFIAMIVVLGLAISGCYYERGYERPYYRYHHDHHHSYDHYGHHDW